MPILGDRLFNELDQERVLCITGALSGGKSRLAFDIALAYWRRGYRVNSNVPHNYVDWMNVREGLFKSFNIADEGGEYIRDAKGASLITRSAGKADYYMIFSGKRLPHKNLQNFILKVRFDFWQNLGIPLILWKGTVVTDEKTKFPIWQYLPSLVHGTYSTLTSSADLRKIFSLAEHTVKRLAEMEGQEAGETADAGLSGLAEDIAEGASLSG